MVEYNKDIRKESIRKRRILSGGPGDHQRRLDNKEVVASVIVPTNYEGYTKEQIDDLLNKVLAEDSLALEKKYIEKIDSLKILVIEKKEEAIKNNEMILELNLKLDKKDILISELTHKIINSTGAVTTVVQENKPVEDTERPSMDDVFIDPSKKGAEDRMEAHVTSKKLYGNKNTEKDINKLKSLIGKLPKR